MSINTLVDIVKWHVQRGTLAVVLTGCCTHKLGMALRERAGVPDVVLVVLLDHAGAVFGEVC